MNINTIGEWRFMFHLFGDNRFDPSPKPDFSVVWLPNTWDLMIKHAGIADVLCHLIYYVFFVFDNHILYYSLIYYIIIHSLIYLYYKSALLCTIILIYYDIHICHLVYYNMYITNEITRITLAWCHALPMGIIGWLGKKRRWFDRDSSDVDISRYAI